MSQTSATAASSAQSTDIRAFQIDVPETELTELRRRIEATRCPERELVPVKGAFFAPKTSPFLLP